MFIHKHPYEPFLFEGVEKLIVGTLPPPRFSSRELKPGDVDFFYGSRDGQLWRILDQLFELDLTYETSVKAVRERKDFLLSRKIGICDIVEVARREKVDASDLGMQEVELRDLLGYLRKYPSIHTLLFTGGNSKNGPEYFFRRLLRENDLSFTQVSDQLPRQHEFELPLTNGGFRRVHTVSLTAPSGSANRAVGSIPEYKARKAKNPGFTVMDFRVEQYRKFF
ncbi:uracil-DNA glycosylase family protein [Lentiprolixibacter aurantiacus]|uniref:Uracil-DNA glycosylase family protein n=1 Tax=Lentiprolixibacter aurantiacus TaxID=2993939 RepID=A0AAE3MKC0_9FLAO|nr:uracil-DNA glycosylase family protein [Lentiprolixibacter aurantiacus]MCX2719300.1 uracil-DNA glycosylase family protein [Lentiprolixibacter aurantiacus]